MRLVDFVPLISNMPVGNQAFASKSSTWSPYDQGQDLAGAALRSVFGGSNEVFLSRSDLRMLALKDELAEFIIATAIWAYPGGMRGHNFASLVYHLRDLSQLLKLARSEPISDWLSHYDRVKPIKGVGLSTYTKLLHFLSVEVQGHTAEILDQRIIDVARSKVFDELASLKDLRPDNAPQNYLEYLECLQNLGKQLSVPTENIEIFLFEFGLHLKPTKGGWPGL